MMLPSTASQSSLHSQPSPKSEHGHVSSVSDHTIQGISSNFNGLSVGPSYAATGNNSYSQPNQQGQGHDMFYRNSSNNIQSSMGGGFNNWTSNPSSPAQPRQINEMNQQQGQLFNNPPSTSGSNHSTHSTSSLLNTSDIVDDKKRNESIDLFLSRSPSQTLGSEFLRMNQGSESKVSSQGASEDTISPPPGISNNLGDPSSHLKMKNGGRDTSPSCSVTGTSASSRTSSPSWNSAVNESNGRNNWGMAYNNANHNSNNAANSSDINLASGMKNDQPFQQQLHSHQQQRRFSAEPAFPSTQSNYNDVPTGNLGGRGGRIGAYHNSDNWSANSLDMGQNRNSLHGHQQQQQPIGLINAVGSNNGSKNEYAGPNYSSHFNQQVQPNLNEQQTQQVFYMAIPTQDGQQVLQPVQMVQVPGQPNAFMLPQGSTLPNPAASPLQAMKIPNIGADGMPRRSSLSRSPHPDANHQMGRSPRVDGLHNNSMHKQHHDSIDIGGHDMYSRYPRKQSFSQMSIGNNMSEYGNDQYYQKAGVATRRQSGSGVSDIDPMEPSHARGHEVVSTLYASPQRPPLKDLLGHVRRLSRDQVGCRLLQQALDEEGDTAATLILNEGLTFWGEAMVDPFGNYLFQKILEKITPQERITLLQNVNTRLVNASLNLHGTRSVQKIVELCAVDEVVMKEANEANGNNVKPKSTAAEILTQSLAPAAARLCIDSHGNHVIQRILLKLPYHYSQFVFDAVASSVEDVARHRHGCCVIQRCLDSPPSKARSNLVHRIVEKALELMQDAYGNYVVQYVLDVCSDDDVHAVCEGVVGKVNLLAIQKFSSNVMEKCLERCTDKTRGIYLEELSDTHRIRELVMDPFGNYVVQKALAVATHAQAVKLVEAIRPHFLATGSSSNGGVRNSAGGRRIMAKICRRFPNFNLGIDNTLPGQEAYGNGGMN